MQEDDRHESSISEYFKYFTALSSRGTDHKHSRVSNVYPGVMISTVESLVYTQM